jgi:hypothetical protein
VQDRDGAKPVLLDTRVWFVFADGASAGPDELVGWAACGPVGWCPNRRGLDRRVSGQPAARIHDAPVVAVDDASTRFVFSGFGFGRFARSDERADRCTSRGFLACVSKWRSVFDDR